MVTHNIIVQYHQDIDNDSQDTEPLLSPEGFLMLPFYSRMHFPLDPNTLLNLWRLLICGPSL